LLTKIEGKDSNFIMSDQGRRFYPSFFNGFVNRLNQQFDDAIIEIKVYERDQRELEIQFIVRQGADENRIAAATRQQLQAEMSPSMEFRVKFVDFIDHDYRRKYRVIERIGDVEFAGGIVGDEKKQQTVAEVEADATASERTTAGV
ncbi:MAG: hypothetical protein ACK55S_12180, partial [Planctomycetota bacterium]